MLSDNNMHFLKIRRSTLSQKMCNKNCTLIVHGNISTKDVYLSPLRCVHLFRAVLKILGALGTNSNLKHNLIKLGYASPQSLFESLRVMHCICVCVTSFYKCINIEINCINININM